MILFLLSYPSLMMIVAWAESGISRQPDGGNQKTFEVVMLFLLR
jgi:hypothetical protein